MITALLSVALAGGGDVCQDGVCADVNGDGIVDVADLSVGRAQQVGATGDRVEGVGAVGESGAGEAERGGG